MPCGEVSRDLEIVAVREKQTNGDLIERVVSGLPVHVGVIVVTHERQSLHFKCRFVLVAAVLCTVTLRRTR